MCSMSLLLFNSKTKLLIHAVMYYSVIYVAFEQKNKVHISHNTTNTTVQSGGDIEGILSKTGLRRKMFLLFVREHGKLIVNKIIYLHAAIEV